MDSIEFVEKVKARNISVEENTAKVLDKIKKINQEYNFFNVVSEELALAQARETDKKIKAGKTDGKLLGLPVSVKDCICVKGIESRAGSAVLSGYVPPFDATVIERIKKEGAIILGKTSQDSFGFGTFSVNVGKGMKRPLNPFDKTRSCGGSSGGSAGITALADFPHISLGESTGGSIACPASFCGVTGFTPTYGRVSRYGLMDYASSMDKIGPIAKTVRETALMLEIIAGKDERDSTSLPQAVEKFPELNSGNAKKFKVGIIKEFFSNETDEEVKKLNQKLIDKLGSLGVKFKEISLPLNYKYGIPAYYLIAVSEASTNLAKFCGIRYGASKELEGSFNEFFSRVRSEFFNEEEKRRIILGTFARMSGFRNAYYLKAMKVRTLLIEEYKKAFKEFDCLFSPTMPLIAPRFEEIEKLTPIQNYLMDSITCQPNLAGLPHLSLNTGFSKKMPVGGMFVADHLQEKKLIEIGLLAEEEKK